MTYVVAMSGGIDSAVAAYLMKKKGKVIALFMKNWEEECSAEEDFKDVQKVCSFLDIDYYLVNYSKEYEEKVFNSFLQEWKEGKTPNPDVLCNKEIKFEILLKEALKIGDILVTGHYAKTEKGILFQAKDKKKDQTYFLAHTDYERIRKVIFPLQSFENKEAVRKYAFEKRLPAATRKDSQGICFLGKISFTEFIKHHCGVKDGLLIDYETNTILGKHNGFWFFTIGQRQGIGLSGGPFYVVKKDIDNNIVFVSRKKPNELFLTNIEIVLHYLNFLVPENFYPRLGEIYTVKLRHGEGTNQVLILGIDVYSMRVRLLFPDQGVARGQFMVFYTKDEKCLGSGMIVE